MKHRLLYEEARELAKTYGVHQVTCGYMREFYIDNNTLEGKCALNNKKCRRDIPVELKDCEVYANFLLQRIREQTC